MRLRRHANQPPIDRHGRSEEHRLLWLGLAVAVIGLLLVIGGLLLPTGVATAAGKPIREVELVKAMRGPGAQTATMPSQPGVDANVPCPT